LNEIKSHFNDIKIIHSKLHTVVEIIPYLVIYDKNDLFALDKDHERWQKILEISETKQLADPELMKQNHKRIVRGVLIANAMVSKAS
jgi:hormone-sensitive lipase